MGIYDLEGISPVPPEPPEAPDDTRPNIDLVKIRKHHRKQMKTLAAISTDLEANLKKIQELSDLLGDSESGEELPAGEDPPEENPDGSYRDSLDGILEEEAAKLDSKHFVMHKEFEALDKKLDAILNQLKKKHQN
jgi:hypothetical protein